jgi:hypothetical protein
MAEKQSRSIAEMIADDDLMTTAIRQGIREELLSQARNGNSVPISEGGKIIWLTPDQIFERLGFVAPVNTKAS